MALVQARNSFKTGVTGEDVIIHAGDIVEDSHPIVRGTPEDYWQPVEARSIVEQATAKPGVKRKAAVPKK